MIPQELIDRLKKCCEWLGKEMPDKFWFIDDISTNSDGWAIGWKTKQFSKGRALLQYYKNELIHNIDTEQEYPNALHRIVKEATGKEVEVTNRYIYDADTETSHCEGFVVRCFHPVDENDEIEYISYYKFPLHAEIEATCIAIEGMMK
jgi:hypothetical protein